MKRIRQNKFILFFIAIAITSCEVDFLKYTNKPQDDFDQYVNEWNEDYQPNYKPRYGILEKAVEYQSADREFLAVLLKENNDTLAITKQLAEQGWVYFLNDKIDSAMFRFNQSWLMDSTYLEGYFGFAAIKEYQGLKDDAQMFYALAFQHDKKDSIQSKGVYNKIQRIKTLKEITLKR